MFKGTFKNEIREGPGTLMILKGEMCFLDGNYCNDRLEGKGKIEYRDGSVLHAW